MCMAYGEQTFRNEPSIEISPRLVSSEEDLAEVLNKERLNGRRRHVFLFSNYLWNTESNLRLSRLAKFLDPHCITIHGGPNAPAYTEASRVFLERERHVDFIVAGEGEETLKELLEALSSWRGGKIDVNGLRYLCEGTFVATADRARAQDVTTFLRPIFPVFSTATT